MVLNNNDGCVIESAEAKPTDQNGYAVVSDEKRNTRKKYTFSSNYELYPMSARVMAAGELAQGWVFD